MNLIKCVILRGGTSKGVYVHENELPSDPEIRDKVILDIFGSPDVRQIDGLGGADILTSKICIVGPSKREDADIDYTFGQVIIDKPVVDYSINCGNLSSGVGPFAIDEGLVKPVEPITTVRIYNTNTKKILIAEVPVKNGKAVIEGDFKIDGVPGTGAKIALDFAATAGTISGKLLPNGKAKKVVNIDGVGEIEVSIADAGNPCIFARFEDIGITGEENFRELIADQEVWSKAELIRGYGAEVLGFVKDRRDAAVKSPTAPFGIVVSSASNYINHTTGAEIKAEDIDMRGIMFGAGQVHKAYPVTGSICTAAAALIEGTLVNEVLTDRAKQEGVVRIGHPAGILAVEAEIKKEGNSLKLEKAALYRTARRILEGYVYLKPWTLKKNLPQMKVR